MVLASSLQNVSAGGAIVVSPARSEAQCRLALRNEGDTETKIEKSRRDD